MLTRPSSWNYDLKGKNSQWILQISDLHTLFTPPNAKSANKIVYAAQKCTLCIQFLSDHNDTVTQMPK